MEFQKNQIVEVTIEDMGTEGEGIGKTDGFTLFVKDAVAGDVVEAKILKCKKNYAYARLEKVLTPSPFRAEPACKFYRQCGGCQLQALSYDRQLVFKQEKIRNNLIRIGGFAPELLDETMESIVGMEQPFHYRNKAQYPVGTDKEGNLITGFYAGRTHSIIANTDCLLGSRDNKEILETILEYMRANHVTAYDEAYGQGLVRHILIRSGFTSGEIMVCLVINRSNKKNNSGIKAANRDKIAGKSTTGNRVSQIKNPEFLPNQVELIEHLSKIKGMTSIMVSINTEKTNVIMGKEIHCIWGEPVIEDTIHVRDMRQPGYPFTGDALTFKISPLSFYQVNPVQTEKLYSLALEYAGLTGKETVWDLYCGIGTISLFLAGRAKQVYGVEIIPQAIEDAKNNASRNHIENAEFFVGKAEEVLPQKYKEEGIYADVIVVDPPRKGCDEACLNTMLQMKPQRIIYVSCDSATLARDLKILCDGGYELKRWRGVDQFGQSVHVETVVLLSQLKQKPDDYINVTIELDDMDITSAETKATYDEIKKYVSEHNAGMKVSNLYISQVKRKCGIEMGKNYNLPKNEDSRQPQCPEDKESAIVEALKHFKMIQQK